MTIAINCNALFNTSINEWLYEYLLEQAAISPQHHFIFILPKSARQTAAANITNVRSSPSARNPILINWWLNHRLPSITRKHQAELLVHTDLVSCRAPGIPQWLLVCEAEYLATPQSFPRNKLRFLHRSAPAAMQRADKIACASPIVNRQLREAYEVQKEKLMDFRLLPGPGFGPADWNVKELTKVKYSLGKEYFLFCGGIEHKNNLVNLLKAFSFFKKRQRSNMRLVICSSGGKQSGAFTADLTSYKYRAEVSMQSDAVAEELQNIMAGAYAFIYPAIYEGSGSNCMQAMQSQVPVIASGKVGLDEELAGSVLLTDPGNFEDIADKMMLLFKDERLRGELIGKAASALLTVKQKHAGSIWASLSGTRV